VGRPYAGFVRPECVFVVCGEAGRRRRPTREGNRAMKHTEETAAAKDAREPGDAHATPRTDL